MRDLMVGGLHDVGELMGQETSTLASLRSVHVSGEVDVPADGERMSREVAGGALCGWVRVDPDGAEGAIEGGLEGRSDGGIDGSSGASLGRVDAREGFGAPTRLRLPALLA
jgi:hypothetical protein